MNLGRSLEVEAILNIVRLANRQNVGSWPRLCENYFGFANRSKNAHYSGFVRNSLSAKCKREHSHARFVIGRGVFTQPRPIVSANERDSRGRFLLQCGIKLFPLA